MESKHHSHDDHTECCHHHDKHDHCKCADHHHEHGPSCGCGHDHEHTLLPIQVTLAGVLFIVNSFVLDRFYGSDSMLSAMSALIGALIMGVPIVWTSIKDLFKGVLSINELVTLAVMAAFASGNYQTAGIVAFFMLLGEIIEMRTADGARKSIESLIKLAPTKARRLLKDGTEEEVPVSMLQIGDVVRVRPGDNVSADGVIVSGQGSFNQANITGESLPVDKKPGDEVFAGTQNLTGVLEIRVSRAGQDTTLGQVHNLILAAEKTRLPILRIIDQYMQYYTPMVLVIATLVWAFTFDLERVIAVLIVACPCAFILATPSAMVAALSAAARLGILIKNVSDIELAARINAFVFDKTGTLTQGKLIVNRLYPVEGVQPAELLQIAASAEKYSNHPTAKAINLLAKEAEIELSEPSDFSETAGRGVSAKVENMAVIIGRSQWLKDNGVSGDFLNSVDLNEAEGFSVLFVARNGQFIGWIGLQDETRAEAKESLADLMQNGVRRIAMVTGDRRPVAARVAKEIGCEEIVAECLPQDKVEFVTMMRERGYRVAVVGDGVNDAPALAAGDVGIAMGAAGSEVAINSATIALMNNDLKRLPFLVKLSRSTRSVINQNFLFGTLFIIFGLGFASWGYINPIVAALLHNAGSLLVVFNSARLVRQGEELDGIQIGEASADTPAKQS
ncbi:MAG: cadmium-translocating P-type ATPase [Verrucomicrobia bacterium]|nr:cadmium-translocating P-type ATPase [Verrucomicrobiota bacterium]MBR5978273.1 cadmium-translocating P-type ATPase [Verrucomicrobiota bacterium]